LSLNRTTAAQREKKKLTAERSEDAAGGTSP
jgi:hypothetical protein